MYFVTYPKIILWIWEKSSGRTVTLTHTGIHYASELEHSLKWNTLRLLSCGNDKLTRNTKMYVSIYVSTAELSASRTSLFDIQTYVSHNKSYCKQTNRRPYLSTHLDT